MDMAAFFSFLPGHAWPHRHAGSNRTSWTDWITSKRLSQYGSGIICVCVLFRVRGACLVREAWMAYLERKACKETLGPKESRAYLVQTEPQE